MLISTHSTALVLTFELNCNIKRQVKFIASAQVYLIYPTMKSD